MAREPLLASISFECDGHGRCSHAVLQPDPQEPDRLSLDGSLFTPLEPRERASYIVSVRSTAVGALMIAPGVWPRPYPPPRVLSAGAVPANAEMMERFSDWSPANVRQATAWRLVFSGDGSLLMETFVLPLAIGQPEPSPEIVIRDGMLNEVSDIELARYAKGGQMARLVCSLLLRSADDGSIHFQASNGTLLKAPFIGQ